MFVSIFGVLVNKRGKMNSKIGSDELKVKAR